MDWSPLIRRLALAATGLALLLLPGCGQLFPPADNGGLDYQSLLVARLGGDTTAFDRTRNAFSLSARNLTNLERRTFEVGDSFFNQNWVTAPASTEARDGLGPTFNAQSCSSCHTHDGRGRPPEAADDPTRGLLLRLSRPGVDRYGAPLPVPHYGGQLQDRAIGPVPPEGSISLTYTEISGAYADGQPYTLLSPRYSINNLAFGPLPADAMLSPRVAPAVFGAGLLAAIPEADLLARADPEDVDGDGISGRPNMVWDWRKGGVSLGRFGWKANQPTVEQQVAAAFLGDIGITSDLFPEENCPPLQTACQAAPNGGVPELPAERLRKITFYNRTLAVPAMRNLEEPQVAAGAKLFLAAGCAACHTPRYVTGESDTPALSRQTIYPYTDLLLHDMGPGLADNRPDFLADGREWRTPPLWGLGLIATVNGHTRLLHDGRARNLSEAILWHGGEAAKSRDNFIALSQPERAALIAFLNAL